VTQILHVGRDHAHLERDGVPRHGLTFQGVTHYRVVPRSPRTARGLTVDHVVWHTGWDDDCSADRRALVLAEVAPVTHARRTTDP
jgi:hypothetical protein